MSGIGVVAVLKVRPGKNADFEAAAKTMLAAVAADEPGCLLYELHKGDDSESYVFLERYSSQEALAAHRTTPHMAAFGKGLGGIVAGPPDVKVYEHIDLS